MTTYWNAFLPIGEAIKSDEPGLDPAWAAAMGVDKDALLVLRRVRRDVLPLVRSWQKRGLLKAFSFLVHDRASGVPCPSEDAGAYIHGRFELTGKRAQVKEVASWPESARQWVYVSRVDPSEEERRVQAILSAQSAWYMNLVEDAAEMSDVDLLRHVGQHLHFFANMAQMAVR